MYCLSLLPTLNKSSGTRKDVSWCSFLGAFTEQTQGLHMGLSTLEKAELERQMI